MKTNVTVTEHQALLISSEFPWGHESATPGRLWLDVTACHSHITGVHSSASPHCTPLWTSHTVTVLAYDQAHNEEEKENS